MNAQMRNENGRRLYTNVALTVIAGLLAVSTFGGGRDFIARVDAQQAPPPGDADSGLVSAAEQRKMILAELKSHSARLERMEAMLSRGLSVKVTEMPPITIPADHERSGK